MTRHDSPHDTLFKEVFCRPDQAAALLRHALPPAISRRIRWDRLELQDSSVRVQHGELRADLLYRAPAPPGLSPFLLLEHKSGPDPATCYQLLGYVAGIWHRHQVRRRRRVVALPAVFAVVVLHGRRGWRRGRKLADLIDWPWPAPDCMPSLPIFVLDLTRRSGDDLRRLPMPVLARLTLFCLAGARGRRDVLARLRAWTPELRALQSGDDGMRGLESVLSYLVQVADVSHVDLERFLASEVGARAKEALMSTLEQFTKEVRRKARAEGRAEGQAQILVMLLTLRFGALPAGVERRVRRATPDQRTRWAERVLTARTLDEVLETD